MDFEVMARCLDGKVLLGRRSELEMWMSDFSFMDQV